MNTVNDCLVLISPKKKLQLPVEASSTQVEPPSSDVPLMSVPPTVSAISTPSDHDLRCLLFCRRCDEGKDCCRAARDHRISSIALREPAPALHVDVATTMDDVESDSSVGPDQDDPCEVLPQSIFDDAEWQDVTVCRMQPSPTLTAEMKKSIRHGSCTLNAEMFKGFCPSPTWSQHWMCSPLRITPKRLAS